MNQEKWVKVLLLIALFYAARPVLTLDGSLLHTIFTFTWVSFASVLLLGLFMKNNIAQKKHVRRNVDFYKRDQRKRMSIGS